MAWSSQQFDSLPSGVRALPSSLRAAWAGAASAARAAGDSVTDARTVGDGVVDVITRALSEIGLSPTVLEDGNAPSDHRLVQLLQHDGLEAAVTAMVADSGVQRPGEDQEAAPWLIDELGRRLAATDGGEQEQPSDNAPGSPDGTLLFITPQGCLAMLTEDGQRVTLGADDARVTEYMADAAAIKRAASSLSGLATPGHADAAARHWRCDRMSFDLTTEGKDAVDRALSRHRRLERRGDQASFESIIDQLRKDGFDDYVTPEGYLRVKVKAARSGVQLYSDGINVWGEYRPIDEVFAPDSLASWGLKPFTNDHPEDFVGVHNWNEIACGVVGEDARQVPGADGDDYVEVTIVICDFDTLVAIKGGKVELSAGYTATLKAERGRDAKGREYRYRQTNIYINHLSLVDRGRAGPLARITVDGFAWQVAPQPLSADAVGTTDTQQQHEDEQNMSTQATDKVKVLLADGVEVEMTQAQSDAYKAAEQKRLADAVESAKREAASQVTDAAKPQLDAFKVQLDAMQAELGKLTTAKAATDAELVQSKAELAKLRDAEEQRARAEVIDTIKSVCPKLALDKVKGRTVDGKEQPPTITDYKAAAVVDLAPHYADAIEGYRQHGDAAFATFVDSLFGPEVSRARKAPSTVRSSDAAEPTNSRAPAKPINDMNSLRFEGIHGRKAQPQA